MFGQSENPNLATTMSDMSNEIDNKNASNSSELTPLLNLTENKTSIIDKDIIKNKSNDTKLSKLKKHVLEIIKSFTEENEICCVLTLYYILECVALNDWSTLKHLLPIVKYPDNSIFFEKWFLSQLVTGLSDRSEYFKINWICNLVFDEFFMCNLKSEITCEFAYKLLDKLAVFLPSDTYCRLLEDFKPKKTVRNFCY